MIEIAQPVKRGGGCYMMAEVDGQPSAAAARDRARHPAGQPDVAQPRHDRCGRSNVVVGIITPWNSPLILGTQAIAPALAMGNAVLLKPDVQTPIVGGVTFARLQEEAGQRACSMSCREPRTPARRSSRIRSST
jgi:hypothetical protein